MSPFLYLLGVFILPLCLQKKEEGRDGIYPLYTSM
nr:MAG TPA: hypothetical protein [Caudoviricetes sp.]